MILGLIGHMRTGKDTIADYLVNEHSFVRVAFADKLKEAALEIDPIIATSYWQEDEVRLAQLVSENGWDETKGIDEVRQFLQRLGVAMRHVDPETWLRPVRRVFQEGGDFVVTDVRFPNEARLIAEYGGALVRVHRDTGITDHHESETALDDWPAPYRIHNDGTLGDLRRAVRYVLAQERSWED